MKWLMVIGIMGMFICTYKLSIAPVCKFGLVIFAIASSVLVIVLVH